MKKGEIRILSDYERLQQFAKLVYAMRRAQKRYEIYNIYDKPDQKAEAKNAMESFTASVDYMLDQILNRL